MTSYFRVSYSAFEGYLWNGPFVYNSVLNSIEQASDPFVDADGEVSIDCGLYLWNADRTTIFFAHGQKASLEAALGYCSCEHLIEGIFTATDGKYTYNAPEGYTLSEAEGRLAPAMLKRCYDTQMRNSPFMKDNISYDYMFYGAAIYNEIDDSLSLIQLEFAPALDADGIVNFDVGLYKAEQEGGFTIYFTVYYAHGLKSKVDEAWYDEESLWTCMYTVESIFIATDEYYEYNPDPELERVRWVSPPSVNLANKWVSNSPFIYDEITWDCSMGGGALSYGRFCYSPAIVLMPGGYLPEADGVQHIDVGLYKVIAGDEEVYITIYYAHGGKELLEAAFTEGFGEILESHTFEDILVPGSPYAYMPKEGLTAASDERYYWPPKLGEDAPPPPPPFEEDAAWIGSSRLGQVKLAEPYPVFDRVPKYHIEIRTAGGAVLKAMPKNLVDGSYTEEANKCGSLEISMHPLDPAWIELIYGREVWLFKHGQLLHTYVCRGLSQSR